MKQLFKQIAHKANQILDEDMSTNGRSAGFRITVITLLAATATFAVYNLLVNVI